MPPLGYRKHPALERFWAKVNKDGPIPEHRLELGPCWPWLASRTAGGYGRFCPGGRKLTVMAHRWIYEQLIGPIPEGLEPDHLCRNRGCVKAIADEAGPAHLEVITPRENTLRGTGPTALNARKTRCIRGHPLDGRRSRGERYCLTCNRLRKQVPA